MSYDPVTVRNAIVRAINEDDALTLRNIFHVQRIRDVDFPFAITRCEEMSSDVFRLCMECPTICHTTRGYLPNSRHREEMDRQRRIHPHVEALYEHLALMDAIADLKNTIAILRDGTTVITSVLEEKFSADLRELEHKEREFCAQDYRQVRQEQLCGFFDETRFTDRDFILDMELSHIKDCSFDNLRRIAELVDFSMVGILLDEDWENHFLSSIKDTRMIMEKRFACVPKLNAAVMAATVVPMSR